MITPVLPFTLQFTSDGTSNTLVVDLSLAPLNLNLRGARTAGVSKLQLQNSNAVAVVGAVASMSGSILTLTMTAPLPEYDGNNLLLVYTLAGLLNFVSLPVS